MMKGRRRIPTLLAAAAVVGGADAASVRGGTGTATGRRRRTLQARAAADGAQEHAQEERGLEMGGSKTRDGKNGNQGEGPDDPDSPYWWHDNVASEKDVVYHPLGFDPQQMSGGGSDAKPPPLNPPPNALDGGQVARLPQGDNNGGSGGMVMNAAGGNGQFMVYTLSVDNDPDTSDLPHKQPSRTPTPKPTRAPTKDPTMHPSEPPVTETMVAMTDGGGDGEEGMVWYPLWYDTFQGCAASPDTPDIYRDIVGNEGEVQYLFDAKDECCAAWFDYLPQEGSGCLDLVYDGMGMMMSEATVETDDMVMHVGGVTKTSDDGGPRPSPTPPSPPPPTPPNPPTVPTAPTMPTPPTAQTAPTTPTVSVGDWVSSTPAPMDPSPTPPTPPTPPASTPGPTPEPTDATPGTPQPTDGTAPGTPRPTDATPAPTSPWPTWTGYNDDPNLPPVPANPPTPTSVTPAPVTPPTPLNLPDPTAPTPSGGNGDGMDGPTPAPAPIFEVTTVPTAGNGPPPTYEPTTAWPTFSPIATPAFDSFNDGMQANSDAAGSVYHPVFDRTSAATEVLYEESFEGALPSSGYFAWGARGNGQWSVATVTSEEGYDGGTKVATVEGRGKFAVEGTLVLTIGGGNGADVDASTVQAIRERGAYVTFGLKTSVGFPDDFLIFRVGTKLLGYWNQPVNEWETKHAYLPPLDAGTEELTWAYSYFGSDDDAEPTGPAVELDGIVIEATTGDWTLSDQELYDVGFHGGSVSGLELHHPDADAGWSVKAPGDDFGGGAWVLGTDTRQVIRAANAGGGLATYHGTAIASFTVVTGPWGGRVHFAVNANAHNPIDVLEVGVDGHKIMGWVNPTTGWEEYTLDLNYPGKHVVTFAHVSNPSDMDKSSLENLGQPGGSQVGGIRYTDNVDPSLLTGSPTEAPTHAPTGAPTPWSIPRQNYCGNSLGSIQDTCYTNEAVTCNNGEECPSGTWCYGNVECIVPQTFLAALNGASDASTPAPTPEPTALPVGSSQNYCGSSLQFIKDNCAYGNVPTCNANDPGCPDGTYCWGGIECEVDDDTTPTPTSEPTPGPTKSPADQTIESFLADVFGGSNEEPEDEPEEEPEEMVSFSTIAEDNTCPDDLTPVQGMPGCCVPDPSFLGDGACDAYSPYNTEECAYDLGDCCRESCDTGAGFGCAAKEGDEFGPFGFYCLDPRYSNINDSECQAENKEWIGDGGCDPEYNTKECGWDGGDCCRQTCDPIFAYYECGREAQPFDCEDPDVIYRADYVP